MRVPSIGPGTATPEPEVAEIAGWLRLRDPTGGITAEVIRDSIDIVLDGQRTGRWCYGHLTKTEKTHLGTVIQIELQKEFDISDDGPLDYAIAGIPVDCKYAARFGKWQIPREMYRRDEEDESVGADHIALLVWAEEGSRRWQVGLLRMSEDKLTATKGNQDRKRTLKPESLDEIYWIWPNAPLLPENTILDLDTSDREAIFSHKHGQTRINELLRRVQRTVLRRTVIITVAQQEDSLKRPRDARNVLRPEGLVVFGHEDEHRRVARELGIDRLPGVDELPDKGEFLAARVVRVSDQDERPKTKLDGEYWALANDGEATAEAPHLPRPKKKLPAKDAMRR